MFMNQDDHYVKHSAQDEKFIENSYQADTLASVLVTKDEKLLHRE